MKLVTAEIRTKLMANGAATRIAQSNDLAEPDHKPVVKFFNPCGPATWLITEIDADDDTMFGLCDLGFGEPELGYVSLKELQSIRLPFNLGIERDMHWKADKTISEYAKEARDLGRIAA